MAIFPDSILLAKFICTIQDREEDDLCVQIMTEELDAYTVEMGFETKQLFYREVYNVISNLQFKNELACAEDIFSADINELVLSELFIIDQCVFDNIWDADSSSIVGDLIYLGEEMTFSEALDRAYVVSHGINRFEYWLPDNNLDVFRNYKRQDDVEWMTSVRTAFEARDNPYWPF